MMRKKLAVTAAVLILAASAAIVAWLLVRPAAQSAELTLYGNIDTREIALAFDGSQRIAAVLVEEGDRVHKGQLLAELDTRRLDAQRVEAEGQLAAQQHTLLRLKHGSRPEEVAQARANVQSAQVDAANARVNYLRLKDSQGSGATAQRDVDNAKAAMDVAEAKVVVSQKALDLAVLGPRKEDIDEAEALLKAREGGLAFVQQQLKDAQLLSPTDGIIRTRILEPGEMASPEKPVFNIAVANPVWVRAYVSETDLGKIWPAMSAKITTDSFPGKHYSGWVGYISPTAEFTPKSVETPELRTKLVYQVRVYVRNPQNELRLGMPATVHIDLRQPTPPAGSSGGKPEQPEP